jgi:hypothetical protein
MLEDGNTVVKRQNFPVWRLSLSREILAFQAEIFFERFI